MSVTESVGSELLCGERRKRSRRKSAAGQLQDCVLKSLRETCDTHGISLLWKEFAESEEDWMAGLFSMTLHGQRIMVTMMIK